MKKRKNPVPFSLENFRRWLQIYMLKKENNHLRTSEVNYYDNIKIYEDIEKYFKVPHNLYIEIPESWQYGDSIRNIIFYPFHGAREVTLNNILQKFMHIFKIIFNTNLTE